MLKNNRSAAVICIFGIVLIAVVICFSLKLNGFNDFFSVTVVDIFTLILTVVVAWFVVNIQSKKNRLLENCEKRLYMFQSNFDFLLKNIVVENDVDNSRKNILTHIKRVSLSFNIALKYFENVNIDKALLDKLTYQKEVYLSFISEYLSDIENNNFYSIEKEYDNILLNINKICEDIFICIYK